MVRSTESISVSEVIDEAVRHLVGTFNPLQIILFGSHARGEGTADSDLDFLVVMPEGTDRHKAAIDMHRRLSNLNLPKDIVVTTPREISSRGNLIGTALRPALREGKLLYERH
jgi:predicted nucleotidyltransferase